MPFNPGQYVFQPRQIQNFDFGAGFRDLAEGRMRRTEAANQDRQAREILAETTAGRQDTNTRYAAGLADTQATASNKLAMERQQKRRTMEDAARKAWASGDFATVDALSGPIKELGGNVQRLQGGASGLPDYRIGPGESPTMQRPDYQGTRQQIFGGGGQPQQPPPGQPFMAPGFGPNGQRNPFDSMPGASAAALPQPAPTRAAPDAGPPPGPAIDAAGPPPGAAVDGAQPAPTVAPTEPQTPAEADLAALNAVDEEPPPDVGPRAPGQSPQPLTGPNPFDPFKLDTTQRLTQNREQLKPYLDGVKQMVPAEYQGRLTRAFAEAHKLGLNPGETLKFVQKDFATAAGLMKSDINRENARASLGLRGETAANTRNDRIMRQTSASIDALAKKHNLDATNKSWQLADGVRAKLELHNPTADTLAISELRNLYQSGVMTDKDFDNIKNGVSLDIFDQLKRGATEIFLQSGLNPDARRELLEVIASAKKDSERKFGLVQNQLLTRVRTDRTMSAEQREEIINRTAELIPESLWDPMLREEMGFGLPQKSGPMDQSGNYPVTGGEDDLGVVPLPGSARASASRSRSGPAKPPAQMNDAEVKGALDELEKSMK